MPKLGHPDPYLRRLAVAGLAGLCVLVVIALLGPDANREGEWYEHTGVRGDLVLLDAIDVVSDRDPVTQDAAQSLPGATRGVQSPITDRTVVDETLAPVPREAPLGEDRPDPSDLQRADPRLTAEVVDRDQVEMSRPAQQSSDFVLLHAVNPRYPDGVPDAQRRREIVVRVNMYVDETGHVAHAYVDRNDGGPRFERAVLEAVRQWVYEPLLVEGEPSGFWDLIYFVFHVQGSGRASEGPVPTGG